MRLSFSTCWNSHRHTGGGAMLEEIAQMGFSHIELGHGIRISLIDEIQRAVDDGRVKISGLHNFCPLPVEVTGSSPNCYEFTSHRRADRARAIRLTRQTIDFAARLGADYVVLHLGTIPMGRPTHRLATMAEGGRFLSRRYVRAKLRAVRARERLGPFYVERVCQCLEPIVAHAGERGIRLGIESREAYEELPSERELPRLLERLGAPHVRYWHDFGHVQLKENLRFLDHVQWLERARDLLIGCHLHDVIWPATDHRVPYYGDMEYPRLVPLIPEDAWMVWELDPRRSKKQILPALERWQREFGTGSRPQADDGSIPQTHPLG